MKTWYRLRDLPTGILALSLLFLVPAEAEFNLFAFIPVILAFLLRIWARCHIGNESRSRKHLAPVLQTGGPYSVSRNPLYLSNLLFALGCLSLRELDPAWKFSLLGLLVFHYQVLASGESSFLKEVFPEKYPEWADKTPFWIGVFRFRKGRESRSPLRAFQDDLWTWIFQTTLIFLLVLKS